MEQVQKQLAAIEEVNAKAQHEKELLVQAEGERRALLARVTGDKWKCKALGEESSQDRLMTSKFRTSVGGCSIRLEKLLLQLDSIDGLGDEGLRSRRKETTLYLQGLLNEADALNKKAARLVDFQQLMSPAQGKQGESNENKESMSEDRMVVEDEEPSEDRIVAEQESPQVSSHPHKRSLADSSEPPEFEIENHPRAYVITVETEHAADTVVTLDRHGELRIVVPDCAPLRYPLSNNIKLHQITKEVQDGKVRVVLPKASAFKLRAGPGHPRRSARDFWMHPGYSW